MITYKEVALTLIPRTRNQARNATECFEDFYDNFNHLMGDIKNYIKQRFATFKEPPLCDFTVFDAKLWPDNLVGFGQKEISNLLTYYQKHNYISAEEKEKAINEWPQFRRSVKLQVKQRKNLFEIYTDLLREGREDMKNILVILNIMLVISASTAAAERDFLKLNI